MFAVILGILVIPYQSVRAYGATEAPAYVSQFGSAGSGDGQFSNPYGIAMDSQDNLYVADRLNHRVQKFDSNGNFLLKFGSSGSGDGQLSSPRGIAVDASGNIYIADTSNHRVQKFDATGTYVTKWGTNGTGDGQFSFPNDIAIDSSGNVFTTELGARVQKFSSSGTFISRFGSAGSGNGQFSGLASVTFDAAGNILIVDGNNSRVQKFDANGTFISKFGSNGFGDGQFNNNNAGYMVLDVYGNMYVSDTYSHRVEKFDSSGNFLAKFGSFGTGNGQYDRTTGMAIDSKGSIYVVDYGHSKIQKYAYPIETSTLTSTVTGFNVVLETPNMTDITCKSSVTESSLQSQDAPNSFPLGLVNFCLTVPSGSTNIINVTFETDLLSSQVVGRKYNSTTHKYADIPNASITDTTVNGNHALKLTYSVTDGGALDDDGVVNGAILDPVGLAVANASSSSSSTTTGTLAQTGDNRQPLLQISIGLLASGFGLTFISWQRRRIKT